jgi:hypothetical protein
LKSTNLRKELVNIYSVALMGSEWNATVHRDKVGADEINRGFASAVVDFASHMLASHPENGDLPPPYK